jgi:hypothetical protein
VLAPKIINGTSAFKRCLSIGETRPISVRASCELEFPVAARYQMATRRRMLGGPTMQPDRSAGKCGGSKRRLNQH